MSDVKNRVLVVDDDVSILRGFKLILQGKGYVVETAETGHEALKKIHKKKFDVCLVDVRLPDMDGTELLLELAESPETTKIIITGFSSEQAGKKAADYGADEFLVKPVSAEELLAAVRDKSQPI